MTKEMLDGLGVDPEMLTGSTDYATTNVGLYGPARFRVAKVPGRGSDDAYRVERRSGHDFQWRRHSGTMTKVEAEALVAQANDPLGIRLPAAP